jgi:23S rRNA pseudouridine1911/1915/1917 synthase
MEPTALDVLFDDAHCLALNKPADLPVQSPKPGEVSLEALVRAHLRADDPAAAYVGIVHRLDRAASGVILWAKTPKAARRLAEQFAGRKAHKTYWAIVEGRCPSDRGLWEDWLSADTTTGLGRVQVCRRGTPRARHAVSRFECAKAEQLPEGCSWIQLWPETGRTHQLRVQSAARGMPILGDRLYGAMRPFSPGIALHARELVIEHPILHSPIHLAAPAPRSWSEQGILLGRG